MQELSDFIKRPNLMITGIEEGEEVQAKGICNIFNEIITKKLSNLEKVLPTHLQEASRTQNRPDQNRTFPQHILIKTTCPGNRERILKAVREKKQITYKDKSIKIRVGFSTETLKARRAWIEVFQALNENNFNPRILYPAKLSFKTDEAIKIFQDKQKLKQCMNTKPSLQKILQGIPHTQKIKENKTMRG
jgi:hypothetical protein